MRHAWIVGCLLFLAACSNKVTDSALALTVSYPGYTPLCLRVTAVDAAASERKSDELITQSKLATDDDRTLILAVYREKSWSQQLRVEVASYAMPDCTGAAIETRQLASAVTLPAKGSVPVALELLAQDVDKDGHAARAPGDDAIKGTDCNDRRDAVHPGATAVCDGRDNLDTDFDCDDKLDCNGGGCTSDAMCGSGFCVAGICCDSACDEPSAQCRGAGTCGTGTCVYPVTTNAACDDGSKCTSGDTCDTSGTCKGTAKTCGAGPGQCYAETGTCNASTGDCEFAPLPTTAACDDGLQCTLDDRCNGSGGCGGTAKLCNTPPNTCRQGTGTCKEPTGTCEYALRPPSSACDDGSQCTLDDRCDGSGTCKGTVKTCNGPPDQCHADIGTCDPASGSCSYEPKPASAACDDGKDCTTSDRCNGSGLCNGTVNCTPPSVCQTALAACTGDGKCQFTADPTQEGKVCRQGGNAGTCDAAGGCQPLRFDYAVTGNFDPVAIAANPIDDLDLSCDATFDSSGTPSWTVAPGCSFIPPTHVVTGADSVVIAVRHLEVNAPLRVVGSRPVILAVYGDATLNAKILAHSAREEPKRGAGSGVRCSGRTGGAGGVGGDDGSGGSGGGLATEGGLGGANDDNTATRGPKGGALLTSGFSPLEGGCQGGDGGGITGTAPGVGGPGGGALQLSVAGTLTLGSVVSVSGAGGGGGDSTINNAAGGGGGGSGGMLVLEAGILVVESTARVTANGGAGGEGSDAKGGSRSPGTPGADGSTEDGTPVPGGDGTADDGGGGGAGAAGGTGPGEGLAANPSSGGSHGAGGGGGGAAGRILLRGVTSCTAPIPAGAILSPAVVSSCPP